MAGFDLKTQQATTKRETDAEKREVATGKKTGVVLSRIKAKYAATRQEKYALSLVIDSGIAKMLAGLTVIATDGEVKTSSLAIMKDLTLDLLKDCLPKSDRRVLESLPADKVEAAMKVLFKMKK